MNKIAIKNDDKDIQKTIRPYEDRTAAVVLAGGATGEIDGFNNILGAEFKANPEAFLKIWNVSIVEDTKEQFPAIKESDVAPALAPESSKKGKKNAEAPVTTE